MADKRNSDQAMAGMLKRKRVWPSASATETCPDAGILAAYFERSLSASEAARWETHFSACSHCQEQLAAMVRSEPASEVNLAVEKRPAFFRLWDWRWMAPVGAAVVVLVFFISFETKLPPSGRTDDRELIAKHEVTSQAPQVAEAQRSADSTSAKRDALAPAVPPGKPLSAQQQEKGGSVSDESAEKKNEVTRAFRAALALKDKGAASAATSSEAGAFRAQPKTAAEESQIVAAAARPAPSPATPPTAANAVQVDAAQEQQKISEVGRVQVAPTENAAPGVKGLQKQERDAVAAEAKERPAQAQYELRADTQAVAGKQEGAVARKAPADTKSAFSLAQGPRSKFANAPGEFIVNTPNSKVLWRFGSSGLIERSRDAGKTWEQQKSPTQESFLSGWAPSEKVCWVGGTNGALLRTTDGGENWERIASPTQGNIVAVKARDQFNATVLGSDGRTYETRNAGGHWRVP